MILAGIDEAGYGPLLGPLLVGCCAIRVPDTPEPPDLWRELRGIAGKHRERSGCKLHINDSKLVYTPDRGLRELERSVLALAGAWGGKIDSLNALLAAVDPQAAGLLGEHRWYGMRDGEEFPIEADATSLRLMVNALAAEMGRVGMAVVHLAARVAPERYLNRMFDSTRNKSSVLFSLSAMHVDQLLRNFGERRLIIHCDRQGGREHYGSLLRLMFEDWSLVVVKEEDGYSGYELHRGVQLVQIIFREKAEAQWMPVAIASMLAKYLREALMGRFNAWWAGQMPGIAPTAGYYTDGMRFLGEVEAKRKELGIGDAEMVRSR
ncbi:MAG: hypothetical protein ABSH20_06055 [Tepidisphaeraceae bacterium]|jgi:hypothetical protein